MLGSYEVGSRTKANFRRPLRGGRDSQAGAPSTLGQGPRRGSWWELLEDALAGVRGIDQHRNDDQQGDQREGNAIPHACAGAMLGVASEAEHFELRVADFDEQLVDGPGVAEGLLF